MKHASTLFRWIAPLIVLIAVLAVTGCTNADGGTRLGVEIPTDSEVIELSTIVENPSSYNGKQVVMKGIISGQCASLCEFFFKDGTHMATVFPQGYKFPKLTKGKPVTVYAQVTSGQEQVVFSALGVHVQ